MGGGVFAYEPGNAPMPLTDAKIRSLKPEEKAKR
jgi:hypothetical protein